jgi:hypothetical protein
MIPVGYMAKHVCKKPDWLEAPNVIDLYSVSGCNSEEFADYIDFWKHNGYWLFDSADVIRSVAQENSIDLTGTSLFYYEAYEKEFDGQIWRSFDPDPEFPTNVQIPPNKHLEGFDVATFMVGHRPECSPLSCNSLAEELRTNEHCLFESFEDAERNISDGRFVKCEPGPYRILSVHSVEWPHK